MNNLMYPKPTTPKSGKYLAWVRKQPCSLCGRPADHAHHIIGIGGMGGMGKKAPDMMTQPLCAACHAAMHHDSQMWSGQWEAICKTLLKAAEEGVFEL